MRSSVITAASYLVMYLAYSGLAYSGLFFLQPRSAKYAWKALMIGFLIVVVEAFTRGFFWGNGIHNSFWEPYFPEEMAWFGNLIRLAIQWGEWLLLSLVLVMLSRPSEKPTKKIIGTCIVWSLSGVATSYLMLVFSGFVVFGLLGG